MKSILRTTLGGKGLTQSGASNLAAASILVLSGLFLAVLLGQAAPSESKGSQHRHSKIDASVQGAFAALKPVEREAWLAMARRRDAGDGATSGSWTATGSLAVARYVHTATLLPNGKVLVAGGYNGSYLTSAELYDPATGTWTATGSLSTARDSPTATLLSNGKVLVAGGNNGSSYLASAELYDPASGTWTATGNLTTARDSHTATLLPNGKVLVAGGLNNSDFVASAELYDVGLGFTSEWQPQIKTIKNGGNRIQLTGKHFQGISQASGGNFQDSSSNYPIVQLRGIDNSQVVFLPVDSSRGWSDKKFNSTTIAAFPSGPALVTVFTNGIPSAAKYLIITQP